MSGEGQLVMPVDCTVRRPDPRGPGRPGRDQLTWVQGMRDRTWTALPRLGLVWPAPWVVAERWCGDSKWLAHLAHHQHGTMVVEGQRTEVFPRPDGRRVTGQERVTRADWPWPLYPLEPDRVYVNFGFWGTVPLPPGTADGYHNRFVEDLVTGLGGHKGLYSTSYYPEDEFWQLYNGQAYAALKAEYDPEGRLAGLYEKCVRGR